MARALITGCSTGIGRATAVELTKRGYDVIATARRPEALEDLDVAERLRLDVDDDASVREAVTAAGSIDVLVNNAGWAVAGPIEKVPLERVRAMFETNVFGVLRMVQAVAPAMRERGRGTIVNVSSVAGRTSSPLGGTYSATKHAVEALTEAMHYELNHFGIRVVAIEPGRITTQFQENEQFTGIDEPPYDELDVQFQAAMGRLGGGEEPPGPELVAQAIAEAIETDEPKLRWPVGADAELIVSVREQNDFESFERIMRETLDLTW